MSNIEWTDMTWNPIVGCTPVSPGCLNCYAATMARRLEAMGQAAYERRDDPRSLTQIQREERVGYTRASEIKERGVRIAEVKNGRAVFTGEVRPLDGRLLDPLHWKKPRRVFVNSMSDLFHESVPFEFIDRVFAVMALCPRHTFQVLTKRPERMAEYLNAPRANMFLVDEPATQTTAWRVWSATTEFEDHNKGRVARMHWSGFPHPGSGTQHVGGWPLPNVWIGTSVEDQARADERIPHLLRCPAAVRFLSCEPLIGAVDLERALCNSMQFAHAIGRATIDGLVTQEEGNAAIARHQKERGGKSHIDWVIVGGESGANARVCDVAWIRSIVKQCAAAYVPVFVKQLGATVDDSNSAVGWFRCPSCKKLRDDYDVLGLDDGDCQCHACGKIVKIDDNLQKYDRNGAIKLLDKKGGDPAEWPEDLRVREWPGKVGAANGEKEGSNGK